MQRILPKVAMLSKKKSRLFKMNQRHLPPISIAYKFSIIISDTFSHRRILS